MTVEELIEALQRFPPGAPVVLWDYDLSRTQSEMQVMRLDAEDVRAQELVWRDSGGLLWLELARSDSPEAVVGVTLGPRERR